MKKIHMQLTLTLNIVECMFKKDKSVFLISAQRIPKYIMVFSLGKK